MHRETTQDRVPEKWLKYELLAEFDLSSLHYLDETIRRYKWSEREVVIRQLQGMVDDLGKLRFCVVKLVPLKLAFLLPNYRVYSTDDLDGLRRTIQNPEREYEEIWYCVTVIDPSQFSVAGRIIVDRRSGDSAQTIEQVWRCSPRLIETIGKDFQFPYIRATRPGWAWRPKVQGMIITGDSSLNESNLFAELQRALNLMSPHRERLAIFEDFVFGCGCDAMSIEYKVEGQKLRFIDWDTHQDGHVLGCWRAERS